MRILCLVLFSLSLCLKAPAENTSLAQGRVISSDQIKAFGKALANQPKGGIFIYSIGWMPPVAEQAPPSPVVSVPVSLSLGGGHLVDLSSHATSVHEEAKTFTDQLADLLKRNGYETEGPSGSQPTPSKGILIRVLQRKGKPMAEALRNALVASNIQNVQLEDKEDEYAATVGVLIVVMIGSD